MGDDGFAFSRLKSKIRNLEKKIEESQEPVSEERFKHLIFFAHGIAADLKAKGELTSEKDVYVFARAYAIGYVEGLHRRLEESSAKDDLKKLYEETHVSGTDVALLTLPTDLSAK